MFLYYCVVVAVGMSVRIREDTGAVRPCPFFLAMYYAVILLVLLVRLEPASSFSPPLSSRPWTTTSTRLSMVMPSSSFASRREDKATTTTTRQHDGQPHGCSRRAVLAVSHVLALALPAVAIRPPRVLAAERGTETKTNSYTILRKLRAIPTFCLVTSEGIPLMVLDPDDHTTASGYFFLSYDTAAGNLRSARQKEQQGEQISNVCANAKIIIVPLGVALQLALSNNQQREVVNYHTNNNNDGNDEGVVSTGPPLLLGTHHEIIVSTEGRDDANEVENRSVTEVATLLNDTASSWTRNKERVPLFYLEGLTVADGKEPRYFNELDLWHEWDRQHPHQPRPLTHLVELLELYGTALNLDDHTSNSTTNAHNNKAAAVARVANVTLMPVADTVQVGKDLMKRAIPPNYNFQQLYLLGGPPPSTIAVTTTS